MPKSEQPLQPDDFPVHADENKVLTTTGQPVALTKDEKTAREVARRLNADEQRDEEDRWSA